MKNFNNTLQILIITLTFLVGFTTIQGQKLNVASYNIRYENDDDKKKGNGWDQRCPIVCDIIRFHDFDIFGAQEVLHKQLNDMLKKLPDYSYIGVGRDDGKTEGEYAPIFYKTDKFDLLKTGQFWLSENTEYPNKGWDASLPRICTWGSFKEKETGFHFWFFNLHMDHIGIEARNNSALLVLDKIKELCKQDPVILTGDFNVDQTHKSYEVLNNSETLKDSYLCANIRHSPNGTFNAYDTNLFTQSRIDHIFISESFTVERYGILTDSYRAKKENSKTIHSENFPKEVSLQEYENRLPSDHFPVKVILSYKVQ